MGRSVIDKPWVAKRFTTQAQFWEWAETRADEMIANGELNADKREMYLQNMRDRQGERAKLIGEIGLLKKARWVNGSTANPKWECDCVDPYGEPIKVIAWREDILHVTGDANSDPWAYGHEVRGIELGDSPDNIDREFTIVMNADLEFRIDPL